MRPLEIAISLPGRDRRLQLPVIAGGNIASALAHLHYWRAADADPARVLDAVDRLLEAIAKDAA